MNSGIDGNSSSSANYNVTTSNTDATLQTTSTKGAEVVNGQISDSTSSGSTGAKNKVYTNLPNAPVLTAPNSSTMNQPIAKNLYNQANLESAGGGVPSEEELNHLYDKAFEKIIENNPNAKTLRLAHYTSPSGTPKTEVEKQAMEEVALQYGLTSQEFNPTSQKSEFLVEVNLSNDDSFASMLENQKPPLSKEEIAKLTFLHYNPGAKFPGSDNPKLQADLKNFEALSAKTTADKFGIPLKSDGTPTLAFKADARSYSAMLNGYYLQFVEDGIGSISKTADGKALSTADKALIQKSFTDPTVLLPPSLAAVASQIKSQAIAQVIDSQNLGAIGFNPVAPGTFPPIEASFKNIIALFNSMTKQAGAVITAMPTTGPLGITVS